MRMLVRNKTAFEYLPYLGLVEGVDDDGMYTGVNEPKYGTPVSYKGNISAPSGSVNQMFDGLDIRYSHVLLMDDPGIDIRETGKILWKGKSYQITSVRPSLNVLSVALLEETADNGDQWYIPPESGGQSEGPTGETGSGDEPEEPEEPEGD